MTRLFSAGIVVCGALLGACGGAKGLAGAGARVPLAPPGVYVDVDVADGFAAYKERLARWGDWYADGQYGVRWCPREPGPDFHPYRERGHWDGVINQEKQVFGAPPGSAYWVSDDAETWGDITMHHGWWIEPGAGEVSRAQAWCWVPGVAETPARVVWRSGGGFVGWAPEPPSWIDDGGEGTFAFFAWTFTLMGTLFSTNIDEQCLEGDAQSIAAEASSAHAIVASTGFARVGPSASSVSEARKALSQYAIAHPEFRATAPVIPGVAPASSTGGSGKTAIDLFKKKKEDADDLPRAMSMVPVMMRDPMIGPVGLTPRFLRAPDPTAVSIERTGTSPGSGSRSDSGGSSSTTHATSWTAHAAPVTSTSSSSIFSGSSSVTPTHTSTSHSSSSTSSSHSSSSSHTSHSSSTHSSSSSTSRSHK